MLKIRKYYEGSLIFLFSPKQKILLLLLFPGIFQTGLLGQAKNTEMKEKVTQVKVDSVNLLDVYTAHTFFPENYSVQFYEDPTQLLTGRYAGVHIENHSGIPGNTSFVNIRGLKSMFFNQNVLFFVDGIPLLNPSNLNIADIKSIEIVKDAHSLVKYGARGSIGIVKIELKRGNSTANMVDFNSSFGITMVPKKLTLLSGDEAFDLMQDLNSQLEGTSEDKSIYWGDGDFNSGQFINENALQDIDWQDRLFDNGSSHQYSLGFSGGNEKTQYRIAGSYADIKGIVRPSDYSRMTLALNVDRKLNKRIRLSTSVYANTTDQKLVNTSSSAEEGGVILSALATPGFLPVNDDNNGYFVNPLKPQINNVDANIHGINHTLEREAILGNVSIEVDLIKDLKLNLDGVTNISFQNEHQFLSTEHVYIGRVNSGLAMFDIKEKVMYHAAANLNYKKVFNQNTFNITAGIKNGGGKYSYNSSTGKGYANDYIKLVSKAANIVSISNIHEYDFTEFPFDLNYNFDEKYIIDLSYNLEKNSRFSKDVRVSSNPVKPEDWEIERDPVWFNSYGGKLTWVISKENFLSGISSISHLDLYTSYGNLINDGGWYIGRSYPYFWMTENYSFNPDEEYTESLFPLFGFNISNLQDLAPEKHNSISFGSDISLYKSRLSLSANYFTSTISDLVLPASDSTYLNSGEMINKGFELSVKSINVQKGIFRWTTDFHITKMKNEVVSTVNDNEMILIGYNESSNIVQKNTSLFAFYGYQTDGIFQNTSEIDNYAIQAGAQPGDFKLKNLIDDNVIDENDRTILGSPSPDFVFGFNNTVYFKGFELTAFIYGAWGQEILNLTKMQTRGVNDWINQSGVVASRWDGAGSSNEIPAASLNRANIITDQYIEDGSYIRLKNLSLAYNIPETLLGKLNVRTLKVYICASNLYTYSDYSGYDPEISMMGPLKIDYGSYPNPKYFGGGISIGL